MLAEGRNGGGGVLDALDELATAVVLVVGDVMLDVYVRGEVERISPEAPVPVIRLVSERAVPGGAANVAANVAALGAAVRLVGVAGADDGHGRLHAALAAQPGVDLRLVSRSERPTTTKTRVVGQRQQIVRIDREEGGALSAAAEEAVAAAALAALPGCGAVLLSDYGKGVLSDRVLAAVLGAARERGIPAIVDPKRRDLSAYRGARLVTPNRSELALATGLPCGTDAEVVAAARAAQALCGADILVTRSEKGMSFVPVDGAPTHLATVAREVFDVSGAGDTVVAVLGACLAAGLAAVDAMRAANHAAGLVVAKFGTATVTRAELAGALHEGGAPAGDVQDGRLLTLDALVRQRAAWRERGLTVGVANGCFDLLHPGHVSLVGQAAEACDRLVMALNTDASVRRLKGPDRPVQAEDARAAVMGALKGVAAVVLFDEPTPFELISALQPDVLVKGADYREEEVVGADIVRARGGRLVLARLAEGQSTSAIIARSRSVGSAAP